MGKGAMCSLCLCEKYDTIKGYITKNPSINTTVTATE